MPKTKKEGIEKKKVSPRIRHERAQHKANAKAINASSVFPSEWEVDEICPLCGERGKVEAEGYDEPVDGVSIEHWYNTLERIMEEHPEWSPDDGSCRRCLAYYGMERAGRAGEET